MNKIIKGFAQFVNENYNYHDDDDGGSMSIDLSKITGKSLLSALKQNAPNTDLDLPTIELNGNTLFINNHMAVDDYDGVDIEYILTFSGELSEYLDNVQNPKVNCEVTFKEDGQKPDTAKFSVDIKKMVDEDITSIDDLARSILEKIFDIVTDKFNLV